jgi:Iron/zinc purple acid phosphatase-like protein C
MFQVGTGGAHLDEYPLYPTVWTDQFIPGEYGYGRITVWNRTDLHFEFVQAPMTFHVLNSTRTVHEDVVVLDDVWIHRSA